MLYFLHYFFPSVAILPSVAAALALAVLGAQVCSSALSPTACGAGTIVICWAFGLAQAMAIGLAQHGQSLSRAIILEDFSLSVTGGILGLSFSHGRSQGFLILALVMVTLIALAISASGWFMANPPSPPAKVAVRVYAVAFSAR